MIVWAFIFIWQESSHFEHTKGTRCGALFLVSFLPLIQSLLPSQHCSLSAFRHWNILSQSILETSLEAVTIAEARWKVSYLAKTGKSETRFRNTIVWFTTQEIKHCTLNESEALSYWQGPRQDPRGGPMLHLSSIPTRKCWQNFQPYTLENSTLEKYSVKSRRFPTDGNRFLLQTS